MKNNKKLDLKNNPNRQLIIICLIFLLFWILSIPVKSGLFPLEFLKISDTKLPTYQMVQFLIIFPLVLICTYLIFIKKNLISWNELGFNKGNKGLLNTIFFGIFGGCVQGMFIFFTTHHFILKEGIIINFFEKCISAPIWEEFLYRILLFTMIEMIMLFFIKKYEITKKWIIPTKIIWYFNIIIILSLAFSLMHGIISVYIFTFAIIATLVYIKTRSIIAPSIAHCINNFVSGGFLYLILYSI